MGLITVLAVEGIGWVADKAAEGLVGGGAEWTFAAAVRRIRERLPALAGTPAGDDLARGLRRAQLRALERVILDYREVGRDGWLTALAPRPNPFFEQALAFSRSTDLPVRWNEPASGDAGLLALTPAGRQGSVDTGAALVEDAVLGELQTALNGTQVPDGFTEHFRNGGRGKQSFLYLFGVYFAEQVKKDAAFREVLHTRLLLQTAAETAAMGSWLARVEGQFGGALSRLESGVADLAAEQRESFAALMEMVAAKKGVEPATLRAILERMGEAGVPDEQIPARLEAKADEYLALREQWAKVGEATPDVEAVRRDAMALIDAGDLDGARYLFADARGALRVARERRAREEAALLSGEAEIDRLQFRYLAAAERYAEAEALALPFDPDARFDFLCKRASAVQQHGDELGDNGALAQAIELWLQALNLRPRAQAPLDWAMVQNNLGNALQLLGDRESGTERLEEAVKAYRAALEEYTRERVPLDWAETQNNLGSALAGLGERESGTARLKEAVDAYRAALEKRTRERVPLDWAMTQNNLGTALGILGSRESGTVRLEEAVNAFHAALGEHTRERVPLAWATTQNNLGNTLKLLGERESGTARLEEAVDAYREALEEYRRERVPLDWAMAQNNLAATLQALGERESGAARLEEAVAACRAALEERTRERVPLDWAETQANLGIALRVIGERENSTARLWEAVAAFRAALEEWTRERVPLDWAMTQHHLGNALAALGKRESGTARLEEAVAAHRAALEIFEAAGADYYIPIVRSALERAQRLLEQRRPVASV
ncbi:MAG TPA: tetratricopeptide repeat protein [Longimicrobium sp.]|nr:tetratricopeptide repeat protein [Longimicrobium sp.]